MHFDQGGRKRGTPSVFFLLEGFPKEMALMRGGLCLVLPEVRSFLALYRPCLQCPTCIGCRTRTPPTLSIRTVVMQSTIGLLFTRLMAFFSIRRSLT